MANQLSVVSDITTAVSTQVRGYVSQGSLQLPANYSAENALKAAMLMLPDIKDANKVPVLKSCTPESIKGALLSMCVQGLNPEKKQCYFLPYGEKLTLTRSYFGDIAVAKQVDPNIEDIYAAAVFKTMSLHTPSSAELLPKYSTHRSSTIRMARSKRLTQRSFIRTAERYPQ